MYKGNGAAKKFMIPEGYDGSIVVLELPSGKTIKMHEGEGYEISEGSVIFESAIPVGITIRFDEPSKSEELTNKGYVVIYGNGTITEVDEDPVKYLEETQRLLKEAEKQNAGLTELSSRTIKELTTLSEELSKKFSETLNEYETKAEKRTYETAELLKAELRAEGEILLSNASEVLGRVNEGLSKMESILKEAREISSETAKKTSEELKKDSSEVLEIYEEIKILREEIKGISEDTKYAANRACNEANILMDRKINQEIEMLKSLRLKLENDTELLMTKLNNAWEALRGE